MVADREAAVSSSMRVYEEGDIDGARVKLFEIGIDSDGIAEYFAMWSAQQL